MSSTPPISGRSRELESLSQWSDRSAANGLVIGLVSGGEGVGKSHVIKSALDKSDYPTFAARASSGNSTPYQLITSLLRNALSKTRTTQLDIGPLTSCLATLLPELAEATCGSADRNTLTEAVSLALIKLSGRKTVVLLLEDLHWADESTLDLLPALCERLQGNPVFILGSYRNDLPTSEATLRSLRSELRRVQSVEEISLRPLSSADTRDLIGLTLGEVPARSLSSTIFQRTLGVPLFTVELCRTLQANSLLEPGRSGLTLSPGTDLPIPDSIRDTILLRLDELNPEEKASLEGAAIAGSEFALETLSVLLTDTDLIDTLFEKQFLMEMGDDQAAFSHSLLRDVVRESIPWSRRRKLHKLLANHLEQKNADHVELAEHFLAAGEIERGRKALMDAAVRACELHAYREAAEALNRALEHWPESEDRSTRISARTQLARSLELSGQLEEAFETLQDLVEDSEVQKDTGLTGELYRSIAHNCTLRRHLDCLTTARERAITAFVEAKRFGDAAGESLALAEHYINSILLEKGHAAVIRSIDLAQQGEHTSLESRSTSQLAMVLAMQGHHAAARRHVEKALDIALKHNHREAASTAYHRRANVFEYASDYKAEKEAFTSAATYCNQEGAAFEEQACLGCMSYALFRMGEWKEAIDTCKGVLKNPNTPPGYRTVAKTMLGLIGAYKGEIKTARRLLEEALPECEKFNIVPLKFFVLWGMALLAEFQRDDNEAEKFYLAILELWHRTDDRHDVLPSIIAAANFFGQTGKLTQLNATAEIIRSIATDTGNPEAVAAQSFILGEAALLQENPEEAAEQFQSARIRFEKLSLPLDTARAEFREGCALLQTNRRDESTPLIRKGIKGMRTLGARAMTAHMTKATEALGVSLVGKRKRQAKPDDHTRGGLSKRQTEVANLIAEGLTNKEVAAKLFLSPRTVDMHVSHILDRLDCRSRSEAVKKLSNLGVL